MTALRVGLIGLGAMGRHHARVIREVDGMDLVGVADANGDAYGVAGGLHVSSSVTELLECGIDMAVVAVPTVLHEDLALELAEAGVHTLVEKPIASDSDAGSRMAEAFRAKGLIGAVGHIERFNPALVDLHARLANGDLGEVYQIATRRQGPFPARIADVGVVKDLATHDIDLARWLVGSRYKNVYAQTSSKSGRLHEDMVSVTGHFDNGVVFSHLINWLSPFKERLTVVTGEKGVYLADTISGDLTYYENGELATEWDAVAAFRGVSEGSSIRYALRKREPLRSEHEAFRDAVLGKESSVVTMLAGLETLKVAEAVLESAETQGVVAVAA